MSLAPQPSLSLAWNTAPLRELILEHPSLPLLVLVERNAALDEYRFTAASAISAEIGEFLDFPQNIQPEALYTSRADFQEDVEALALDNCPDASSAQAFLQNTLKEHAPYWKPCILLRAGQ